MAPRGDPLPAPTAGDRLRLVSHSSRPGRIEARRAACRSLFRIRPANRALPVEGESFLLRVSESWREGARRWLAGEISDVRLDVAGLRLEPLALVALGPWDDRRDQLDGLGPAPAPARTEYELERIPAEAAPGATAEPPFHRAIDLWAGGELDAAHDVLAELLRRDLRCLAAHSCLGFFAYNGSPPGGGPARALRHYEVALAIVRPSVPPGFRGVLPWARPGNRAFLRCLYGRAICLWRMGDLQAARAELLRVCRLNPGDQLAARLALDRIDNGPG